MITLYAPEILDVSNSSNRGPSCSFFDAIRRQSRRDGVGITLDFRSTARIYPSGALLLLAELDRALSSSSKMPVQCRRPVAALVDGILQQIGIYDRLGVECASSPDHDMVRHWRQATGVLSEGQKGGSLLEEHEGRLADGITKGLYAGVVEAMTNTVHHAYIGNLGAELRHGIGRRWWMLSQEKDGKLTVAICDLGIGIPRSLPRSETFPWPAVQALWRSLKLDGSDASAIEVALQIGKTRTNQAGRGKGLAEIVDAVNLSDGGSVFISSNRGVFTSSGGKSYASNHSHPIRGTLIHWHVPIQAEPS